MNQNYSRLRIKEIVLAPVFSNRPATKLDSQSSFEEISLPTPRSEGCKRFTHEERKGQCHQICLHINNLVITSSIQAYFDKVRRIFRTNEDRETFARACIPLDQLYVVFGFCQINDDERKQVFNEVIANILPTTISWKGVTSLTKSDKITFVAQSAGRTGRFFQSQLYKKLKHAGISVKESDDYPLPYLPLITVDANSHHLFHKIIRNFIHGKKNQWTFGSHVLSPTTLCLQNLLQTVKNPLQKDKCSAGCSTTSNASLIEHVTTKILPRKSTGCLNRKVTDVTDQEKEDDDKTHQVEKVEPWSKIIDNKQKEQQTSSEKELSEISQTVQCNTFEITGTDSKQSETDATGGKSKVTSQKLGENAELNDEKSSNAESLETPWIPENVEDDQIYFSCSDPPSFRDRHTSESTNKDYPTFDLAVSKDQATASNYFVGAHIVELSIQESVTSFLHKMAPSCSKTAADRISFEESCIPLSNLYIVLCICDLNDQDEVEKVNRILFELNKSIKSAPLRVSFVGVGNCKDTVLYATSKCGALILLQDKLLEKLQQEYIDVNDAHEHCPNMPILHLDDKDKHLIHQILPFVNKREFRMWQFGVKPQMVNELVLCKMVSASVKGAKKIRVPKIQVENPSKIKEEVSKDAASRNYDLFDRKDKGTASFCLNKKSNEEKGKFDEHKWRAMDIKMSHIALQDFATPDGARIYFKNDPTKKSSFNCFIGVTIDSLLIMSSFYRYQNLLKSFFNENEHKAFNQCLIPINQLHIKLCLCRFYTQAQFDAVKMMLHRIHLGESLLTFDVRGIYGVAIDKGRYVLCAKVFSLSLLIQLRETVINKLKELNCRVAYERCYPTMPLMTFNWKQRKFLQRPACFIRHTKSRHWNFGSQKLERIELCSFGNFQREFDETGFYHILTSANLSSKKSYPNVPDHIRALHGTRQIGEFHKFYEKKLLDLELDVCKIVSQLPFEKLPNLPQKENDRASNKSDSDKTEL
ncbi:uncharacterized protein LOC143449945 isoform X2 [Clavelina lepadiformis]|uniref:uncharacterized protein LOC143449945 isoform X2 n=1 Tax=Clavelina lepadiformis TaxID=159417 RepID=UPI0040437AAD